MIVLYLIKKTFDFYSKNLVKENFTEFFEKDFIPKNKSDFYEDI